MTYSPFDINHMDYLKSIISTSCRVIVSYYIVKAYYMAHERYQSITNIVPPSSNMITQGIIFFFKLSKVMVMIGLSQSI